MQRLLMLMIFIQCTAYARTIRVPEDFATIQAALDASETGDEVVVAQGLYEENIDIDAAVTLRSEFDGKDWSVVEKTIIKAPDTSLPAIMISQLLVAPSVTIRGFTLTREKLEFPPTADISAHGISARNTPAVIEYNIIEHQVSLLAGARGFTAGAGVVNCSGIIQNNILRYNVAKGGSALFNCNNGIIRNNVFYHNSGAPILSCSSDILNNTLYDNGSPRADPENPDALPDGGIVKCTGEIINNIIWRSYDTAVGMFNPVAPRNCVVQGYEGPGEAIIRSDPKLVDPENGDFRLREDSPCIDAGRVRPEVKADIRGVSRMPAAARLMGGGISPVDIGAFEFVAQ